MKERLKLAFNERRKLGLPIGRPRSSKYEEIIKYRAHGLSIRKIASRLNCSSSTVQAALKLNEPKNNS
jgi:DNA-binding NarL/FixJ family response regulator